MLRILCLAAFALTGISAFASHHDNPACAPLRAACEKAGYTMHGHKTGKGLIVDCLGKLAKGEKVEGVDADPADPANKACIEHFQAMKEKRRETRREKREKRREMRKEMKSGSEGAEAH